MKYFIPVLLIALTTSCGTKEKQFDADGTLLAQFLEPSGALDFSPMQNDDSSRVADFSPLVYTFKNKPYTGKVTAYDDKQRKIFDGNLNAGVPEGNWKFYYASGVVQIEGTYTNGLETGIWKNYYTVDKPKVIKQYDESGYLLMRKEFYDTGKLKNYQNVKCPQYGDIARRVQFKYNGAIDYLDAERDLGKLSPEELQNALLNDKLMVK